MVRIAMIGGSGFDHPDFLSDAHAVKIGTPFGPLSADPIVGKVGEQECVILLRHGHGHRIRPSAVNYRANLWALKELGVTHIIATTACGSLREHIQPGHLVFPDQFIDFTRMRKSSFHEGDQVVHISMADPFCANLRTVLTETAKELDIVHHEQAVLVTIEGPRFSTRAESRMFRILGGDVINMSTVPEAVLARELGICYAAVAMSTDYDAWHDDEEPVTWEMIAQTMAKNVENVRNLFFSALPGVTFERCECSSGIDTASV